MSTHFVSERFTRSRGGEILGTGYQDFDEGRIRYSCDTHRRLGILAKL